MIKAVLIDLDNTILKTQELYTAAEDDLARLILSLSDVNPPEVAAEIQHRKLILFESFGYDPAMLPQAFEESLLCFAPDASAGDILAARALGRRIFEEEAEIKDGAEAALRALGQHFALYLVTVGEEETQRRRISTLPCADVFHEMFIVPDKTPDVYLGLLRRVRHAPQETVMIGDSLKSDIIPAVQAGMTAIHIPGHNWHGREMQGLELPRNGARTCQSLREAADFLVSQIEPAARPVQQRRARGPSF